ncbi:MAG: KpsF/GutQ family sugar-phosphate isomerase [Planctomycetota bacterium]
MKQEAIRNSSTISNPFEILRFASDILKKEADAINSVARQIPIDFYDAAQMIANCQGCVIVTGVGKAGWIGQKVSASLASLGTRSHFLHPSEALHGDLGRVGADDVVLILSNSGETSEVVCLLPTFTKLGSLLIGITGSNESTLAKHCDAVLDYGKLSEACPLGLAPTTSTAVMLGLGDALALSVAKLKEFQSVDFAKFHPGGSLGKKLSSVDDLMRPISECRVAKTTETVRQVYIRLGGKDRRAGAVLIADQIGKLVGIFTDSDLAKLLEQQKDNLFDCSISEVMTRSPVTIQSGSKMMLAIETFACRNLSELPVVDREGRALGIVEVTDVVGVSSQ